MPSRLRELPLQHCQPRVHYASRRELSAGRRLVPHRSGDLRIVCVVEGRIAQEGDGFRHEAPAGSLVICDPLKPAAMVGLAQHSRLCSWYGELLPDAAWAAGGYRPHPLWSPVTALGDAAGLVAALIGACADTYTARPAHAEACMSSIARAVILAVLPIWSRDAGLAPSPRLAALLAHIDAHLGDPLGRCDLAARFHLSPAYLNQLFKRGLGVSLGEYLRQRRCREAHRLMHQSEAGLDEIARLVGFSDPRYLSRVYRSLYGVSPGRDRRR
jgi:AraC-like DNA-binding protein